MTPITLILSDGTQLCLALKAQELISQTMPVCTLTAHSYWQPEGLTNSTITKQSQIPDIIVRKGRNTG
jgi:hypothetical protein